MKRNWSISRRLILIISTSVGLLWLCGAVISTAVIRHEINEVFDSALQEAAQRLLPLALEGLDADDRDHAIGASSQHHEEYLIYQLRDRAGRVLLRSHDAPAAPYAVPLVPGLALVNGQRFYTDATADGAYLIQVMELPGHRTESIVDALLGLIFPLLLLVPLAGLVIFGTVRRTLLPIRGLREAIGQRGGRNLAVLSAEGIPRELVPIVHDINRLLARLDHAITAERDFSANSAHELRTPVAAAIAQAQRLGAELAGTPHVGRVELIVTSLRRLAQLAEKLLQLSRAESGVAESREVIELLPVVNLVVDEFDRLRDRQGRIRLRRPEAGCRAAIDIDAFAIVLRNLLENALAHGTPEGAVEVFFDADGALHVINDGAVVPPAALPQLTERFVRGTSGGPGSGLGLAIVAMILLQVGGRLELRSPATGSDQGFEAIAVLPSVRD